MTTNTGMPALETWVRQLNGELQVEKYSKKTEDRKSTRLNSSH